MSGRPAWCVAVVRGFGDEHDVDVADVVQLRATRLAHGDDGEPARLAVGLREGNGKRRPQGRGGEVRELRGDVLEREDRQGRLADGGEVGGGEGEHLVAVGDAQGVHGLAVAQRGGWGARGACRRCDGVRTDGRQQRHGAGGDVGARVGGGRGQPAPAVGMGDEVVAERGGAAEQGEQPPAEHDVTAQRGVAGPPLARVRAREPVQRTQREVGVGAAGEGPHDVLGAPRGLVVRPPAPASAASPRPAGRSARAGRARWRAGPTTSVRAAPLVRAPRTPTPRCARPTPHDDPAPNQRRPPRCLATRRVGPRRHASSADARIGARARRSAGGSPGEDRAGWSWGSPGRCRAARAGHRCRAPIGPPPP